MNTSMRLRKLFAILSFFTITPLFLLLSVGYFSYLHYQKDPSNLSMFLHRRQFAYAALPGTDITLQAYAQESDGRVAKLEQFFRKYGSPLEPYAQNIVAAADKYSINRSEERRVGKECRS